MAEGKEIEAGEHEGRDGNGDQHTCDRGDGTGGGIQSASGWEWAEGLELEYVLEGVQRRGTISSLTD